MDQQELQNTFDIQQIYDSVKPLVKDNETKKIQMIHFLRRMQTLLEQANRNQTSFHLGGDTSIKIDVVAELQSCKLHLDKIFSQYLTESHYQSHLHNRLGQLLMQASQNLKIKKSENIISNAQVAVESEEIIDQQQLSNDFLIHSKEEKKINKTINLQNKDILFGNYRQDSQKVENELIENENEIISQLDELSGQMKRIVVGINVQLNTDNKLIEDIDNKQDKNSQGFFKANKRLDSLINTASLGWFTLIIMLLLAIGITIFTIIFIKLF